MKFTSNDGEINPKRRGGGELPTELLQLIEESVGKPKFITLQDLPSEAAVGTAMAKVRKHCGISGWGVVQNNKRQEPGGTWAVDFAVKATKRPGPPKRS